MDRNEVAFAGVVRQAQMVAAGEVTPRELVEICLERIERHDPVLNSFKEVWDERALAEADAAAERRGTGDEGPLNGVPLAVKDTMDVRGSVTSHGTAAFDKPAAEDSEAIARLRRAGAVLIGKTNLPELAICGFTETDAWGITRNPWDTSRTPGGSSGGSAAAVAAGLVPAATASDGAGSIRWPAACCGLFGLKPQRGRIPIAPYPDAWHGLSVNGFVTRSVADSALLMDVAVAGGPTEADAPPVPSEPYADVAARPPGKLRIGWTTSAPRALARPIQEKVGFDAMAHAVELLRSLGHEVAEVEVDWGTVGNAIAPRYLRGISDDAEWVPNPERLERQTRGFIRLGKLVPGRALRSALAREQSDRERIGRVFDRHDVLLTPMLATQPVEIGRWHGRRALPTLLSMSRVYPMAVPFNHTGQPAASVPAGFDDDGLPRSVQLVGRPADEATLISLAAQMQAEQDWSERRPALADQPAAAPA